jgi:hypothetical protein
MTYEDRNLERIIEKTAKKNPNSIIIGPKDSMFDYKNCGMPEDLSKYNNFVRRISNISKKTNTLIIPGTYELEQDGIIELQNKGILIVYKDCIYEKQIVEEKEKYFEFSLNGVNFLVNVSYGDSNENIPDINNYSVIFDLRNCNNGDLGYPIDNVIRDNGLNIVSTNGRGTNTRGIYIEKPRAKNVPPRIKSIPTGIYKINNGNYVTMSDKHFDKYTLNLSQRINFENAKISFSN